MNLIRKYNDLNSVNENSLDNDEKHQADNVNSRENEQYKMSPPGHYPNSYAYVRFFRGGRSLFEK